LGDNILSPKKGENVKVIFLEDVPRVARVGQTKVVADGYARNYLFPRKLAVLADSQAAAALDTQLKKKVKQRELEDAEMTELAKKIGGLEITLKAKVGENDKLYGSITGADIAEALSKAAGRDIDKRKIELPEPIKQAGAHDVIIRLAHEISAVIKVNVISEEAVEEKPEKKAEKPVKKEAKAEAKPEKTGKKEKKEKKEKPPAAEKPVEAVKEEKPAKEKKARKPKTKAAEAPAAVEKPAAEKPAAEKKEKKPRAKARKAEAVEENKEP
jgi:large subunit ribosomal protein L9